MDVQNNKRQLFWSEKRIETLLVLNIVSIGSFFIIASFLNPQNMIKWCTIAELWLVCAYLSHRISQQPKNKLE
jgi:hypothetical protein